MNTVGLARYASCGTKNLIAVVFEVLALWTLHKSEPMLPPDLQHSRTQSIPQTKMHKMQADLYRVEPHTHGNVLDANFSFFPEYFEDGMRKWENVAIGSPWPQINGPGTQ